MHTVDIDASVHEWSNYFKCGYKGIFEKLKLKATKSLMIMMDGTVPLGGGLSSSAAFVCCSALGTMVAYQQSLKMGELTQVAIDSERYAGVQSGGMDGEDIDDFMYSLKKDYYQKILPNVALDDPILNEYIFASKPGSGCGIFENLNV